MSNRHRRRGRSLIAFAVATASIASAVIVAEAPAALAWTPTPQCANPVPAPDVRNIPYSSATTPPLAADVFYPPGGGPGTTFPTIVTVPGGSWQSGCRGHVAEISRRFADMGYVVFAISTRVDCDPAKPQAALDDPSQCVGPGAYLQPITDIERAVLWARKKAQHLNYGSDPHHVALFGESSSAHEVVTAADLGVPHKTAPEVVVGWSAVTEARIYADGSLVCDPANLKCMKAFTTYIGCTASACPAKWDAVSGYSIATATAPPAFDANGTTDSVPARNATDYADKLTSLGVPVQACLVTSQHADHGLYLADLKCDDTGVTTFDSTVAFVAAHI